MCNHPTLNLELTTPNEGWYRCADCREKFSTRLEPFRITVERGKKRDRIAELEKELAAEERAHLNTIDQRDQHEERINEIACALGLTESEREWSSMNDVGEVCEQRAWDLRSAIDAAMAATQNNNKETN